MKVKTAERGPSNRMALTRGSHVTYSRGEDLVVEWYDFGPHAPYESANLLVFDRPAQLRLATAAGADVCAPHELARQLALKFDSYFDVKRLAEEHAIPFAIETDFQP